MSHQHLISEERFAIELFLRLGGINFRKITEEAIRKAVERLNNRPRKCLGYRTPAEVFAAAQSGAFATALRRRRKGGSERGMKSVLTEPPEIPIVPAMKDLFLADAHLLDPADDNYRRLLALLERERGKVRTLYLLGDIFEFWVGYEHVVFTPYVPILEALRRLHESGTQIVWVEGNHDFHLGPFVRDILQATIIPEAGGVSIDGQRVFLCHGDLLDPSDRGYRLYRAVLRNRLVEIVVHACVSPDRLWRFSRFLSARSQAGRRHRPPRDPRPLIRDHARRRFAEGYDIVVTGHFHTPFIETTAQGTIVALGDAMGQASCVICEDGRFRTATF